jgi:hypothetical protein
LGTLGRGRCDSRRLTRRVPFLVVVISKDEVLHSNPGESDQDFLARALLFYGAEKGYVVGSVLCVTVG